MSNVNYSVPEWFEDRLHAQSRGQLRIRWSAHRDAWHIEQKVGRASLPPFRLDPHDDSLIRARDGYWFVMEIRAGDRMPCPKCFLTIKLTPFANAESVCQHCKSRGVSDGRVSSLYFPLGESLLEHLRMLDPERDGIKRAVAASDERNRKAAVLRARALSNSIESHTKDHFNEMFDIQQTGYSGKVFSSEVSI